MVVILSSDWMILVIFGLIAILFGYMALKLAKFVKDTS
jgi:hypothetical protein